MKREHGKRAAAILASSALAAGWQGGAAAQIPGVVLHETHRQSSVTQVDTIHTYFTPERVLMVHAGGRTLLDLAQERVVLVGPGGGETRSMPLREWEAEIQKASGATQAEGDDLSSGRFEEQERDEEIAGYRCARYHHFGRRTLLGSQEYVEQQIWVTREIDMPEEAYEAYRRALDRIDSIGRPGVVPRPPGVVLAMETRTWPVAADRRTAAQVQRFTVYAVEQRTLPDSLFHIPVPGQAPSGRR